MTWRNRLTDWLNSSRPAPLTPGHPALREAVDAGRRAKFNEDYPAARAALDRAYEIALQERVDAPALTAVVLQRAEVLARMGDFDAADTMLTARLAAPELDAPRAFFLCASALVASIKGEMGAARAAAERALDLGKALGLVGAEGRALGVLAATYAHDGNAGYAARLLREALPKVNTTGEIELSSDFVGRLGEALIETGQDAEGAHLIERALTLAEQIGYRMYERRWKVALGTRALKEGRYQDARNALQRAIPQFKADAPTPEYADALIKLAGACLGEREYQDAFGYAQIAVRAAESVGDPALIAAGRGARGNAARGLGNFREAIPDLQAAIPPDGAANSDSLRALAVALSASGDADGSRAIYARALTAAERADQPLEIAAIKRDLGLLYAQAKQMNAAIAEWTAALAIYEAQKAHAHAARLYCDLASARRALGQTARALKDIEGALTLLSSLDPDDLDTRGRVLSNAATAYAESGDAESADAFFNEAISLAERANDPAAESVRSSNYGWFLLQAGRPRRALSLLGRALQLSQSLNLPLQHAVQTDNMGLTYQALGDANMALEYHQRAITEAESLGEAHWAAIFRAHGAAAHLALNAIDAARTMLAPALSMAGAGDHPEAAITVQIAAARIALAAGDLAGAGAASDDAIRMARRAEHRRLLAEALHLRSRQLAAAGDLAGASAAWEEAAKLYTMLHMPDGSQPAHWLTPAAP